MIVGGTLLWSTEEAADRLQVRVARLYDWVRRSKQADHEPGGEGPACPGCLATGFPHVDPPVRDGGLYWYRAEQLLRVEQYTAESTRGGAVRADA